MYLNMIIHLKTIIPFKNILLHLDRFQRTTYKTE